MSDTFPVHTTKYDGSLHYRFDTVPVYVSDDLLALHILPGTTTESYRGPTVIRHDMLMIMWPQRHWKLSVRWRENFEPGDYYVDIITPADWSDGTLRLSDLDLDLLLELDDPRPLIDDTDEFEAHIDRFAYPPDLVSTCLNTVLEVAAMMARKDTPFDGRLHAWRPGKPLDVDALGPATPTLTPEPGDCR